jgi:iron-sulfur cluster repair protein YtfE (RIC family)
MSLVQGRAASAIRRLWHQEKYEVAQVAARVSLVAGGVTNVSAALVGGSARGLLELLENEVLPYLDWEEAIVHPVLDRLDGTSRANRALRAQLEQVRAAIGQVQADWAGLRGAPTPRQLVDLQTHLRRLGRIMAAHLEQEERALAPVLAVARA